MFQTKMWSKSKHTFYVHYFFFNRVVYEKIWKNAVELERPQMTIYCGLSYPACKGHPIACRVTKATNTHSEYVTLFFHANNGYVNEP